MTRDEFVADAKAAWVKVSDYLTEHKRLSVGLAAFILGMFTMWVIK